MIDRHAIIIGGMKCGTTALFYALRQHPRIAAAREKEPGFFQSEEKWAMGSDWYDALWDWDPAQHVWAMEASTAYTKMPQNRSAAPWARVFGREFRFVYMVRDPVQRIRSHYLHMQAEGYGLAPIFEGVHAIPMAISNYWVQITPYVDFFGPDSVKVVSYLQFCRDPVGVTRDVLQFLDLDPAEADLEAPGPRNASNDYLRKLLNREALAAGLPPCDDEQLLNLPFDEFVSAWALHLGSRERVLVLAATLRRVRAAFQPTEQQADQIHARLRDDLSRFTDRFGIDPWACG